MNEKIAEMKLWEIKTNAENTQRAIEEYNRRLKEKKNLTHVFLEQDIDNVIRKISFLIEVFYIDNPDVE